MRLTCDCVVRSVRPRPRRLWTFSPSSVFLCGRSIQIDVSMSVVSGVNGPYVGVKVKAYVAPSAPIPRSTGAGAGAGAGTGTGANTNGQKSRQMEADRSLGGMNLSAAGRDCVLYSRSGSDAAMSRLLRVSGSSRSAIRIPQASKCERVSLLRGKLGFKLQV